MNWNKHFDLEGKHAFLSPSGYHWINYEPEYLEKAYLNNLKKEKGTMLHAFASVAIKEGIKLADYKKALNQFVNDAIGLTMESEQPLYFSENCFGTADAIRYDEEEGLLRVHDLKTGTSKASFNQLLIYCAIFCLEYRVPPMKTTFVTRIYQGNGFVEEVIEPAEVKRIMSIIKQHDKILKELKSNM